MLRLRVNLWLTDDGGVFHGPPPDGMAITFAWAGEIVLCRYRTLDGSTHLPQGRWFMAEAELPWDASFEVQVGARVVGRGTVLGVHPKTPAWVL